MEQPTLENTNERQSLRDFVVRTLEAERLRHRKMCELLTEIAENTRLSDKEWGAWQKSLDELARVETAILDLLRGISKKPFALSQEMTLKLLSIERLLLQKEMSN